MTDGCFSLSRTDERALNCRGISVSDFHRQLELFSRGTPFVDLARPAVIGDGIQRLEPGECERLANRYLEGLDSLDVIKMVPASGAATRMFKPLMAFLKDLAKMKGRIIKQDALLNHTDALFLKRFFSGVRQGAFAFSSSLDAALRSMGSGLGESLKSGQYNQILQALLAPDHLDYARRPKALIPFHGHGRDVRTPLDEHFLEAMEYGCGRGRTCRLHFTVSEEHYRDIQKAAAAGIRRFANKSLEFAVEFSQQERNTDTIALDAHGTCPLRNEKGELVFRPGGHGALIGNLAGLDADLVFLKNIDNVMPAARANESYRWKKILAGFLLEQQHKVFELLREMEKGGGGSLQAAETYLQETCLPGVPQSFSRGGTSRRAQWVRSFLNRPIRVCGMVVNRGEPGGGPFWVRNEGLLSLQIVERAQIDLNNSEQKSILANSTHFNPVDLVCGIRDYLGRRFSLREFVNPDTYFVTRKYRDGRALLALEWPGLWNGAMDNWLTHFIEVPESTFAPVKTINDLLRPEHSEYPPGS